MFEWLKRLFGSDPLTPRGFEPAVPPPLPAQQSDPTADRLAALTDIARLVRAERNIEAVDRYRQLFGVDIPTARAAVAKLVAEPAQAAPAPPPTPAAPVIAAPAPPTPRRVPRPLNLDAGLFAAMSDRQVRLQATDIGLLSVNRFFGRRDLIPPTSDPRTLLIDRAMVGHGLLTPEQLAEIHRVGLEMEQYRGELIDAAARADEALRRTREAKAALKAQKKAEAVERKRLHAEAVAHRRQTDIVFLGRGVSVGLADRRSNIEKLKSAGLPALTSPADVAAVMELTIPRLRWLAFHSEAATVSHYIHFFVPKRSGGQRRLSAPHADLATAQRWIFENILNKVPASDVAHGFVTGRNTVSNATPHIGRALVVNTDLVDFFPTITFPRVRGIFIEFGYSPAVATVLALLCTEAPRKTIKYSGKFFHVATGPRSLPQGACTSPALSNLAARRMDARLTGIAKKLGWVVTRYADDLTFSCEPALAGQVGYLLARIRHITHDEGFAVNEKKTRVQRKSSSQTVTGVVVNSRPGVSRTLVRRLRAILHKAKFDGLAAQNREKRPNFEPWLRGMIAYVHMINPKQGEPLRDALRQLDGEIR